MCTKPNQRDIQNTCPYHSAKREIQPGKKTRSFFDEPEEVQSNILRLVRCGLGICLRIDSTLTKPLDMHALLMCAKGFARSVVERAPARANPEGEDEQLELWNSFDIWNVEGNPSALS